MFYINKRRTIPGWGQNHPEDGNRADQQKCHLTQTPRSGRFLRNLSPWSQGLLSSESHPEGICHYFLQRNLALIKKENWRFFPKNLAKLRRPACLSPSQCLFPLTPPHAVLSTVPATSLRLQPPHRSVFSPPPSSPGQPRRSEVPWFCLRSDTCELFWLKPTIQSRQTCVPFGLPKNSVLNRSTDYCGPLYEELPKAKANPFGLLVNIRYRSNSLCIS